MASMDSDNTNSDEEDVARGAAWMDEQMPGWEEKVDPDNLFMFSTQSCILGQTFGPRKYLELFDKMGVQWVTRHAFASHADEWREQILTRQELVSV